MPLLLYQADGDEGKDPRSEVPAGEADTSAETRRRHSEAARPQEQRNRRPQGRTRS